MKRTYLHMYIGITNRRCRLQKMRCKGDIQKQQLRRKERCKTRPPRQEDRYQLIDGNWTHYPIAECKCHRAYLTQGLIDTHRCLKRKCSGLKQLYNT